MGLSLRAYARHRGVSHTAVQKALRSGRIPALPDGTIDPTVADAAWNAAAEAARGKGTAPADPRRVVLPARSLAAAEATVRTVLADHGMESEGPLRLQDVRVANELLRAQLRADTIRAQRARVYYGTGISLDAEDDAASEEAAEWWAWCETTAATLAKALGVRRTRLHERLAVALRARLVALGLVAGDDEEEDEENDREEDDDEEEEDDDKPEPLHVEADEDDQADQDEEAVADEDADADEEVDADQEAHDLGADEATPIGSPSRELATAVDPAGALADDLDPADEPLEEEDDTGDADRASPIPVPVPSSVPSPSAATAADATASPTPPPTVVPLPGTQSAVPWRHSTYWPGRPPRWDHNDR